MHVSYRPLEVIKRNMTAESLVCYFNNRGTGLNHLKHTQVIKQKHNSTESCLNTFLAPSYSLLLGTVRAIRVGTPAMYTTMNKYNF
jgi:hypothetical protein